jgi:two-component sensor histidine kinase
VHNPVVRQMLVHPDDLERHEAAMQAVRDGTPGEVEYRLRHPDKGLRWLRVRTFPFIENGQPMNAGLVEDITAQKQTEQSRLDDALHLRDALTREVHHRIKNNLQTVVGLLRREGSRHPHAREPILAAIAQVQSVAVVHGLSSRGGQREVNLCELLPEVVNNVSKLYGANMMHIEGSSSCAGLQIKESETVAVALILNELVSNAIKHTADEIRATDAPRVTMRRAGMHGDIRIINPGRLPLGFDFDGGVGLGTGLDLVKTLMPTSGMEIRIMQVHDDMVEVDVQIEPPVLDETTFVAPPR